MLTNACFFNSIVKGGKVTFVVNKDEYILVIKIVKVTVVISCWSNQFYYYLVII